MARDAIQLIQNPARFDGVRRAAAGAQGFQVLLKRAQLADAFTDAPLFLLLPLKTL